MHQRINNHSNREMVDERYPIEVLEGEIINGINISDGFPPPMPLTLDEVLDAFGPFPPFSLVFGICEDGLPLMLNLKDPTAGSLLIQGADRCGKSQLLETILGSAAVLNPPDRVNFCVITPHPDEMAGLLNYPHCQVLAAPYERQASEIILELSALAEQRRFGRERGPAFILAIDDFGALTGDRLDYEVFLHLKWLISKGPGSEIWTIATLPDRSLSPLDPQLSSLFQTQISNYSVPNTAIDLLHSENITQSLIPNWKPGFTVRINRQIIRFIPLTI